MRATPSTSQHAQAPRRLDPRDPLVLDTRELGRRPGSMRTLSRVVPAPEGFGNDVLSVPVGAEVALDLRLEAVMEGVLVTGTATATATGECVRCLDPLERALEAPFQELYTYPATDVHAASRGAADDEEALRLEGDLLDLDQTLRDAVVLALPLLPVCEDDCPGLCPDCGQRLADDAAHTHQDVDPRWSALQNLLDAGPDARPAEET